MRERPGGFEGGIVVGETDVARRYADALIASDEKALNELCSPDVEFIVPGMSAKGVQAMLEYNGAFLQGFPDANIEIVNTVASGDTAVLEILYRGTNTGPMAAPQGELPPTGKEISIPGCMVVRTEGGKVASFHGYFDQMTLMQQLGAMG
jgi:predicted ester cyclase